MNIDPSAAVLIDPGVVTLIQSTFLEHINTAFDITANYAFNLLYLFAALEIALFGLMWAFQRNLGWEKLLFKIIKIGLIFFVIQNYSWLLSTILESFSQLAGVVVNEETVYEYVFNPAKIWQYGYDAGVNLLQLATNTEIFGLAIIQVTLGIGILLVFGLLGIQMVVQIIGFYVVSFGALILLPFGALTSSRNMFDKAVQAVLQAGLRLMVLIMIIGIGIVIWEGFDFVDLESGSDFNLNQPMGLFFTGLLFLSLALYLPKIISQAVGELSSAFSEGGVSVVTSAAAPSTVSSSGISGTSANMQAATTISPGGSSSAQGFAPGGVGAASTVTSGSTSTSTGGTIDSKSSRETLSQASKISRSISENTIKKIKAVVSEIAKEK